MKSTLFSLCPVDLTPERGRDRHDLKGMCSTHGLRSPGHHAQNIYEENGMLVNATQGRFVENLPNEDGSEKNNVMDNFNSIRRVGHSTGMLSFNSERQTALTATSHFL